MAKIVYFKNNGSYIEFSFSNKPDMVFLCDTEDYELIEKFNWHVHKKKNERGAYIRFNTLGKLDFTKRNNIYFHRLVLSAGDHERGRVVDHINRNTLDCRKSNLRIISDKENLLNCERIKLSNKSFCISHKGISIMAAYNDKKNAYQSYHKNRYVASSKSKDSIRKKVIRFIKEYSTHN